MLCLPIYFTSVRRVEDRRKGRGVLPAVPMASFWGPALVFTQAATRSRLYSSSAAVAPPRSKQQYDPHAQDALAVFCWGSTRTVYSPVGVPDVA
jgi:hypothetical protein